MSVSPKEGWGGDSEALAGLGARAVDEMGVLAFWRAGVCSASLALTSVLGGPEL